MKLKKKDLDALRFNYLEQSVANLQLSNCEKDVRIFELELEKKRLEIDIKRNVGKTLFEKMNKCKIERKDIIEQIKKDYDLEEFKGYDPETGEIALD